MSIPLNQASAEPRNYFNVRQSEKNGSFHARFILGDGGGTGYYGSKLKKCASQILLTIEDFKDRGALELQKADKITVKSIQSFDDAGRDLRVLSPELLSELVDSLNSQSPIFIEGEVDGYLGLPSRARR